MQVWSLVWEDPLEEGMATHSSILVWRIPWTEEPGRLHTVHGIAKSWTQLGTSRTRGHWSATNHLRILPTTQPLHTTPWRVSLPPTLVSSCPTLCLSFSVLAPYPLAVFRILKDPLLSVASGPLHMFSLCLFLPTTPSSSQSLSFLPVSCLKNFPTELTSLGQVCLKYVLSTLISSSQSSACARLSYMWLFNQCLSLVPHCTASTLKEGIVYIFVYFLCICVFFFPLVYL